MPRNTASTDAPSTDAPEVVTVNVEGTDIDVSTLTVDDIVGIIESQGDALTDESRAALLTRVEEIDAAETAKRKAAARKAADARKSAVQRRADALATLRK